MLSIGEPKPVDDLSRGQRQLRAREELHGGAWHRKLFAFGKHSDCFGGNPERAGVGGLPEALPKAPGILDLSEAFRRVRGIVVRCVRSQNDPSLGLGSRGRLLFPFNSIPFSSIQFYSLPFRTEDLRNVPERLRRIPEDLRSVRGVFPRDS